MECTVSAVGIDYHHGNGTQARGSATDYPFFWGHETGEGAGKGITLNMPLPRGTSIPAFRTAQATALDASQSFDPGLLIVSFGADTWEGDPIAHFKLTTNDYTVLPADITARGRPAVIVMEGGYATDMLGRSVAAFLAGFA